MSDGADAGNAPSPLGAGDGRRRDPRPGAAPTEGVDLDTLVFRTRALGQSHPFSPRAYRYSNAVVNRQRVEQPVADLGIWAGHALTVGYCLRCVEEDETGAAVSAVPADLPDDLDAAATHVTGLLRTTGAEPYLLFPEELVVALLDRLIEGELERRIGNLEQDLDAATQADVEEYLAWWTIKGYALRVVDVLLPDTEPGAGVEDDDAR